MALTSDIRDREFNKFREASDLTKVAVSVENEFPIEIAGSPELPIGYAAVNYFNQISSVSSGSLETVISKTISTESISIDSIEVSGDNKSEYRIFINASLVAVKRTQFTELNQTFNFGGLKLVTSDVLEVKTIHNRPSLGTFEARVIGIEKL